MVNLEAFLEIDEREYWEEMRGGPKLKRNIYVLDTHRPWNLDNLFGSQIVTCFDDGTVEETLQPQQEAFFKLLELEEQELANGDESGDETEEGNTEDDDTEGDDTEEDTSDGDKDEDDDEDGPENEIGEKEEDRPVKRKKSLNVNGNQRKVRKRLINKYENVIEEYYAQGTSTSNSLSVQVYSLLSALGETTISYLWLAILGATSLDASYPQIYNRLQPLLQDEVKRLSPNESLKTPDTLSLEIQPDYYLFLLRHSSLYDSFFYSNYVNAKLAFSLE